MQAGPTRMWITNSFANQTVLIVIMQTFPLHRSLTDLEVYLRRSKVSMHSIGSEVLSVQTHRAAIYNIE